MADSRPLGCPSCSQPMQTHALSGKYGQPLSLDLCFPCSVLWFDGYESLLLAPGAILTLFTLIHEHRGEQQHRAIAKPGCPRCRVGLAVTHDRQRHVQFHYWRCPGDHGRLTTFVEFLREKDFVRPLAPAELAELRARVRTVRCDGCGAAVDLNDGSECRYCRSPVSTLDPHHVDSVVRELRAAETKRATVDPTLPARLAMDRVAVDRFFDSLERGSGDDLVGVGIAAVVGMLTSSD